MKMKQSIKATVVVDKIFKVLTSIIMFVYAISLLIPLIWMLYTSVKPYDEYMLYTFQLPKTIKFSNYAEVLSKLDYTVTKAGVGKIVYGLDDMLIYSLIWATANPLLNTLTFAMTSYVVSRYRFPGRNFLYALGIFLMITPIIGGGPATLKTHKMIGDFDNMTMRILVGSISGAFYGFNFILLYGAWKGISWFYAEAAFIDGANNIQVFFKVMFPLIVPTCAVLFFLGFLGAWNDYMNFITWLPSYPSLAVGMYMFQYNSAIYMVGTPTVLAGFTVTSIPTTILYFLSQKVIMAKLNVGGLKG